MYDLTSKKFGRLLVIKKIGKLWECRCDCGEVCLSSTGSLNSGHKKSCGCKKKPNLIGKKFNRLTVIKLSGIKNGKRIWECKCDCGNVVFINNSRLINGRKQSCGCKKREDSIKRQWKGFGEMSGSLWTRIVRQAKQRNFEVKISKEDCWELFLKQERKCALTGLELKFSSGYKKSDGTASLDRINSKYGYEKGNVQWIHKDVNQMKMDLPEDYFLDMCNLIANNNKCKKEKNESTGN